MSISQRIAEIKRKSQELLKSVQATLEELRPPEAVPDLNGLKAPKALSWDYADLRQALIHHARFESYPAETPELMWTTVPPA